MRLMLAVLLAFGPLPAEAHEPVFDALSHLLSEYAGPVDQKAAEAAPEEAAPPGVKLAQVQSDLSLMAEGFEVFRHPSHATQALRTLPEKIVPELRPFFKDRDSSLDTIYRTLAVTDYTWSTRFPEPPCDPRSRRRALLSSKDGLFTDPKTGELSGWLARLLGPAAYDRSAEDALDTVSSKQAPTGREYELLRLKVRKISEALESDKAVGAARSKLYCARAQAYEDLASAHRSVADGPIQAALSQNGKDSPAPDKQAASIVLMAILEGPDQYRSLGAGVLVDTGKGPRVLTDARLLPERDEAKPSLRAFARPEDGKTLGAPLLFLVEKIDQASGVMVGRLEGAEHIPALKLAGTEPALNDLVRAIGHMSGTGAWTVSQGLVTAAGKGTFTTDALLGPDMLGSPLLNDQGEVAGLAVLPNGTGAPAAVTTARLRELLEDGSQIAASSDIEFIESQNRGSASVLTAAMPTFGAGLSAPGAKPLEASQYIYSQTQWGTVRGKCMANCGGGSSSSGSSYGGSSYDSGGKELGEALGKALAPVVEALIFKGIPALFRGIGSLFSKSKASPAAPPPRHTTVREPTIAPEKPKEPAKLTGLTLEASPSSAAPGEKVTLTARVSLSDPETSKAGIPVAFKATPETLVRFDGKPQANTDGSGLATIVATLRRDHGVRTVKTGDTKAVKGKSDGAQSELDDEVRAMSEASADSAESDSAPEKAENITFEASANVGRAVSSTTSVVLYAQDIISGRLDAGAAPYKQAPAPTSQDASIAAQRAYVTAKVHYSHRTCDPTGTADMSTGVDCSCLMLKGDPKYFQRDDGSYVRTAQEQHDLMVTKGNDSLTATELEKGDILYLRGPIDDSAARIEHAGRVTEVLSCGQCSGCTPGNGDVCLKMIHAPHPGRTVAEENTTLHNDKDKSGTATYCIHKKNGAISQCLTGGGRFPWK